MDLRTKKAQKAKQYLDTHRDRTVGPSELAKAIECTRGTARGYIAEWMKDQGDSKETDQGGQSASTSPDESTTGESTGQTDQAAPKARKFEKDFPPAKKPAPKAAAAAGQGADDQDDEDGDYVW